jgi:hypothetical protein
MLVPLVALSLFSDVYETAPNGEWTISYNITRDGPLYEYQGVMFIHGEVSPIPCLNYSIEVPEGDIVGCFLVFDQFTQQQTLLPIWPFDTFTHTSNAITGTWCSPAILEPWQSVPYNFKFLLRKSTFNADDLSELLSKWGTSSTWDLNGNGTVDGEDIALMLGSWEGSS